MNTATNPLRQTNIKTIQSIKKGLKEVGTQKVLKRLGFTQQNLSKHLREKEAENANLAILNKIIDAISFERKLIQERAEKLAKKASELLLNTKQCKL